ncbi:MAG: AAA family ATPase [Actinomycetota bacterium]|nr:AAA family ATPase [Actinomycetota bacterium]
MAPSGWTRDELAVEQAYITALYRRVDELRARARSDLSDIRLQRVSGLTHQGRSERDSRASMLEDRVAQLDGIEEGLCFGRIDRTDDEQFYIGRIGVASPTYDRLLVDWRAPAARPFYAATPRAPQGVVRRRHIRTRQRVVLGIEDDVLDLNAVSAADQRHLAGEGALLAALNAGRTGHMRDMVATIQAEQDAVIRSGLDGVLVVEGGPGTGKTAVALHRAAYLLYEHRLQLASRGVLVVGPGDVFLRYIERVLPSLGETGVLLSTISGLYRGARVTAEEPDPVAAVKGDLRMADVLGRAIRLHQTLPEQTIEVRYGRTTLEIERNEVARCRERARRSRRPHNGARAVFLRELLNGLVRQVARALDQDVLDAAAREDLVSELREHDRVVAALDAFWPVLTPEDVLRTLLTDPQVRTRAADRFGPAEQHLLGRPAQHGWTAADMPLLDELADRLGSITPADPAAVARRSEEEAEEGYAAAMLDELDLMVPVDASVVAARYRGTPTRQTAAERAGSDQAWAYGHVIVDEAQELSPMAWRMLARRCPSRSMTVVGDLAQASGPSSLRSWAQALDPYARGHWSRVELTVNYRTPTEIMAVAADVLRVADPQARAPEAIRSVGEQPLAVPVRPADLATEVARLAAEQAAAFASGGSGGTVGIIVASAQLPDVAAAVSEALPEASTSGRASLDTPAVVLTPRTTKGLEFDTVIVVEPAAIVAERDRGQHDLYVALSRATQRLFVVHADPLPDGMVTLRTAASDIQP